MGAIPALLMAGHEPPCRQSPSRRRRARHRRVVRRYQPTLADLCLASVVAVMRVFKITVPDTPTIDRIVAP